MSRAGFGVSRRRVSCSCAWCRAADAHRTRLTAPSAAATVSASYTRRPWRAGEKAPQGTAVSGALRASSLPSPRSPLWRCSRGGLSLEDRSSQWSMASWWSSDTGTRRAVARSTPRSCASGSCGSTRASRRLPCSTGSPHVCRRPRWIGGARPALRTTRECGGGRVARDTRSTRYGELRRTRPGAVRHRGPSRTTRQSPPAVMRRVSSTELLDIGHADARVRPRRGVRVYAGHRDIDGRAGARHVLLAKRSGNETVFLDPQATSFVDEAAVRAQGDYAVAPVSGLDE